MRNISALQAALAMTTTPALVRTARRSALPPGMTFLLEVAANDTEALDDATGTTGQSHDALRTACGFFIEQILLTNNDDSYRILAGSPETPANELRRHMALLLKWLHPDVAAYAAMTSEVDRSLFANRVTQAWDDLKTEERRAAYARLHVKKTRFRSKHTESLLKVRPVRAASKTRGAQARGPYNSATSLAPKRTLRQRKGRQVKRLTIQSLGNDSLFSRLVSFLKGKR